MNFFMLCSYCKREMVRQPSCVEEIGLRKTRDHYIPLSRGGLNVRENIRPACYLCNTLKSDMMPDAWAQFMCDNPKWWETDPKTYKWVLATPIVKGRVPFNFVKNTPAPSLAQMTAEENARRMEEYLKHTPTKEHPIPRYMPWTTYPPQSLHYKSWKQWRAKQGLP